MDRALTPLQKAYLLGRSEHLPLGGVAMQEFREYRGRIDIAMFRARLLDLVRRHECLRTRIDIDGLVPSVSSDPSLNLEEIDLRARTRAEALSHVDRMREEFAHRQCDLARALWEAMVFRLPPSGAAAPDEDTGVVFLRFDGLVVDGRSIASLVIELFSGEDSSAEAPTRSAPSDPDPTSARGHDAAYWTEKLRAISGPPRLPWSRALETIRLARYERQSLVVGREQFATLSRIGARMQLFKNSTLMAVALDVLARWLDEGSLCVGIPVAPRDEGKLGNRSSFIVVDWDPREGGLADRAKGLQTDVLEALEHLSFSGVDITRLLLNGKPRAIALPVVITNGLSWPVLDEACPMRLHAGLTQTPQVAIDIRFSLGREGGLVIDIDYVRAAIEQELVRDILGAIGQAIAVICATGTFELMARDILDYAHYRLNGDERDFQCSGFLQRIADNLFSVQSSKPAVICDNERISYVELGVRVGRVMAALLVRQARRGSIVAVCLPRGPEQVVITLACALVGAVWVPIDATLPVVRLRSLLDNCRPNLVVARDAIEDFFGATVDELLLGDAPAEPLALAPPLEELSASAQAAFYLYTSGTTGTPKCVVLTNRAASNVILSTIERWHVTGSDTFISVTPVHHDMSVFDVFGCLTAGATLVLPTPAEERDAIRWNQLVAEHGVTLWCSVPAILEMLLACRRGTELRSLRLVAQGGDYIKPAVIAELRQLIPSARLVSLGGPTETTIWSIWHEVGPGDIEQVPYGQPLPGNRYFVLNDRGEHCPAGVVGRIHSAGVNVALGYLESGTLTQNDFVTVDDEKGEPVRTFRSGDCGRYRRDGTLLFAGRVAGYVKVRGVRVSLLDIENELLKHPAISRALVVDYGVEQHGETKIGVLYVLAPEAGLSVADLRTYAKQNLPESHVPVRFISVDVLPLSANGKLDRRRGRELLTSVDLAVDRVCDVAAYREAGDQRLLGIYLSVLGKSRSVGVDDTTDFMTLGLLPSHLQTISKRICDEFGIALAPRQLLLCRNASQLKRLCQCSIEAQAAPQLGTYRDDLKVTVPITALSHDVCKTADGGGDA